MKIIVDNEITLREITLCDAEDIFNTIDSERVYLGRWLPFVDMTQNILYTKSYIENYLTNIRHSNLTFCILYNKKFVGLCGLKDIDFDNKKTEIGYWISEKEQGKGIVTRSCKALIRHAFNKLNLNRVQIKAAVENTKSKAIPERIGFIYEGIERDGELHKYGYVDLSVYSLLRRDCSIQPDEN